MTCPRCCRRFAVSIGVILFCPALTPAQVPPVQGTCVFNCASQVEANQNVERSPATVATFSGGDGSSAQVAFVIENASSEAAGVLPENDWIKLSRPGSRKISQAPISRGKHLFDEIELVMPDGGKSKTYFDVTGFFGKY